MQFIPPIDENIDETGNILGPYQLTDVILGSGQFGNVSFLIFLSYNAV